MQTLLPADLMTVRQVAALFHIGEKSILSRIKDGRLPAQKLEGGKQWLIRREDALAALPGPDVAGSISTGTAHLGVGRISNGLTNTMLGSGVVRRTHTPEGRTRAVAMLHRLREGDAQEQTQTWDYLKASLDEDRLSGRKLFSEQRNGEQDESE